MYQATLYEYYYTTERAFLVLKKREITFRSPVRGIIMINICTFTSTYFYHYLSNKLIHNKIIKLASFLFSIIKCKHTRPSIYSQ